MQTASARRFWLPLVALWLGLAVLWFTPWPTRVLVRPDEARWAEMAREMWVEGEWLAVQLNGLWQWQYPPAHVWLSAISWGLFGDEGARFPSVLASFITALIVGIGGLRLFGYRTGLYASLLFASSPLVVILGHWQTPDSAWMGWLTLSWMAIMCGQQAHLTPAQRRTLLWLAWTSAALATLTGGLASLGLLSATVIIYAVWQHDLCLPRQLYWRSGLAIYAVLVLPWLLAMSQRFEGFATFFLRDLPFNADSVSDLPAGDTWWVLLLTLGLGGLPWWLLFGMRAPVAPTHGIFAPTRWLWTWVIVSTSFLLLAHHQAASRVLIVMPALCLLLAWRLAHAGTRGLYWLGVGLLATGLFSAGFADRLCELLLANVHESALGAVRPWLQIGGVLLASGALMAMLLSRFNQHGLTITSLALSLLLCSLAGLGGYARVAAENSSAGLAPAAKRYTHMWTTVYSVGLFDASVNFYLRHRVVLVAYDHTLQHGLAVSHQRALTFEEFEHRWRAEQGALAVMSTAQYEAYLPRLPMQLLGRASERVLVRNPEPAWTLPPRAAPTL